MGLLKYMSKSKTVNGILDLDSPQMKHMRETVIEQELSARSWKAYYEKMYYSLESEKLEVPYAEYQERAKKRVDEQREKMEAFQKALQEEMNKINEADPVGTTELKAV